MGIWELQNPDGKLVKSASISEVDGMGVPMFALSVKTIYGYKSDLYETLLGAKMSFGRHFHTGGKWKVSDE